MLTLHCDQNNSYEITINVFQVRKVNEIRNVIRYGKPSSALRPKLGCSPSWVFDEIQIFWGKTLINPTSYFFFLGGYNVCPLIGNCQYLPDEKVFWDRFISSYLTHSCQSSWPYHSHFWNYDCFSKGSAHKMMILRIKHCISSKYLK